MGIFQVGDKVCTIGYMHNASQREELQGKEVYEVVRQMPNSMAERGYNEYELSGGALVPEHQLVLWAAAAAPLEPAEPSAEPVAEAPETPSAPEPEALPEPVSAEEPASSALTVEEQ